MLKNPLKGKKRTEQNSGPYGGREGSVVKSIHCSSRGPSTHVLFLGPTQLKKYDAIFCRYCIHAYIYTDTHMHINKTLKGAREQVLFVR